MYKKKRILYAVIIALFFAISPLNICAAEVQTATYTQRDLNEQEVMELLWTQTSAEYRGLCYQAYNVALLEVDRAITKHPKNGKPLAIILDCDETVLDNSLTQAGYLETNNAYSEKIWEKWVDAARADAMPGAVECLQKIAEKGVEVFYVTNRSAANSYEGTVKNLKNLKFPMVDQKHLLLKTDTGNKKARFEQVSKDYDVILYMGDNAGDFPIGTYHKNTAQRNDIVDQYKKDFGTRFIILPNPQYGDWEGALSENYWNMTPEQKSIFRKSLIKKWRPN